MAMNTLLLLLAMLFGMPLPPAADDGRSNTGITVSIAQADGPRRGLPLPRIIGPQGRPLVVIDAGHGGRDPGAISPGRRAREKDVTLALARAIRDALAASGRVRVALTREGDNYLELQDRYEIARQLKADLFVSVHADAAPNPQATGATIYTLSEVASDAEAALLADRENASDIATGADLDAGVSRILIDLAQRESMEISARFAAVLHREAAAQVPFRPTPHRFASLVVLKAPDVPSILFEAGYLTHDRDLAFIASPDGQARIAQGMRRAIETHFARKIVGSPGRRS